MRRLNSLVMVSALALLAMSCGPRPPCMSHHGEPCHGGMAAMAMAHGACGPESCAYRSRCFSPGAVQSNGGVCQACSAGKWVSAEGCSTGSMGGGGCCGMMGKGKMASPCQHGGGGGAH